MSVKTDKHIVNFFHRLMIQGFLTGEFTSKVGEFMVSGGTGTVGPQIGSLN